MNNNILQVYGWHIIEALFLGIATYIGLKVKNIYLTKINSQTKKDVVKTCVQAIEQVYTDIHGDEKLDKCVAMVQDMLEEKGIETTELEIHALIESAVHQFNSALKNTDNI